MSAAISRSKTTAYLGRKSLCVQTQIGNDDQTSIHDVINQNLIEGVFFLGGHNSSDAPSAIFSWEIYSVIR